MARVCKHIETVPNKHPSSNYHKMTVSERKHVTRYKDKTTWEILMKISRNALQSNVTFTRSDILGGKDKLLKTTVKLSSKFSALHK